MLIEEVLTQLMNYFDGDEHALDSWTEAPPIHGGIKSIEWSAYGDWITYNDGYKEYINRGE